MKHQHRFVAIPITGQGAGNGREGLLGFKLECEQCYKRAKVGDIIEEVKQSWWKEIMPEPKLVNYVVPSN